MNINDPANMYRVENGKSYAQRRRRRRKPKKTMLMTMLYPHKLSLFRARIHSNFITSLALYANSIVKGAHQTLHDTQLEMFFFRNVNGVATTVGQTQHTHMRILRLSEIRNSSLWLRQI